MSQPFVFVQLSLVIMTHGLTEGLLFLGDDLTLCEVGIEDGEDIFVWNGVEVSTH